MKLASRRTSPADPSLRGNVRVLYEGVMDEGAQTEEARRTGLHGLATAMRPKLHRFLLARGCDHAEADDLLQDLYIKVEEMRSGPISNPQAYLFQTVNNMLLDQRRGRKRQESRDDSWARGQFGHELIQDPSPTPEQIAIARNRLARLERELANMPPRTVRILQLYRVDGHSQKVIANQLGISLSAVEKHLQRAYQLLRDLRQRMDMLDAPELFDGPASSKESADG